MDSRIRFSGGLVLLLAAPGCPSGDNCVDNCSDDEVGETQADTDTTTDSGTDTTTTTDTDTDTDTTGTADAPPDAPEVELVLAPIKRFEFTWSEANGADDYQIYEQASADAELLPVGDAPTTETSLTLVVPLHRRVDASYVVRACNDFGCTDSQPVPVASSLAEAVGYFKAGSPDVGDLFGLSVALSADGATLVVGASAEDGSGSGVGAVQDDNGADDSGAVYVYTREGATWSLQSYIKASSTDAGDNFGRFVALSGDGDTLAVGASGEASGASGVDGNDGNNSLPGSGAVYLFTRAGDSWSQQAYIKASNPDGGDDFGWSLALSSDGDTLAVGAPDEASDATGIDGDQDDDSAAGAGAVYLYARARDAWSQQAYLKASNTDPGDSFGQWVSLSGDGGTLAVGAQSESSNAASIDGDQSDNSLNNAGAAYVFTFEEDAWAQQAYIKASNPDANDSFGSSLSLSGDGTTLAVGAYREASASQDIDGDQADNSAVQAGAAYVYARTDTTWEQQAYLKAPNADAGDAFAFDLELTEDGNFLVVAAVFEDSDATGIGGDDSSDASENAGAVHTFVREGGGWSWEAYVKAPNSDPDDGFGYCVAVSSQSGVLAIGASFEDGDAAEPGGDPGDDSLENAGAVYLY